MNDVIIRVENLGKRYRLGARSNERYTALRDVITDKAKSLFHRPNNRITDNGSLASSRDFWALRDINFEVRRGEVVGIIGRNAAGKSTLLKILSRITEPTEGRVRIKGRVASLLEVGTGFHPELTGRENIFLNGAILGMTRAEIQKKFDEIVDFAEIEKFLETPVKRYSSGMYVRLAFAVAAHLEPEILVVDEVLAVGDAEFQKKCLGKMQDVASKDGRTILFVSHNMTAVQGLCGKAIYLDQGRIRAMGNVEEMIREYLRSLGEPRDASSGGIPLGKDLRLQRLEFSPSAITSGQPVKFVLEMACLRELRLKELALILSSEYGARVAVIDFRQSGCRDLALAAETLVIEGTLQNLPLVEGDYRIGLYLATDDYHGDFHDIAQINVGARPAANGVIAYSPLLRGILELDFDVKTLSRVPTRSAHDAPAKT
jgi:lipopolysaccharide transport system ATP-binding protein